MKVAAAAEQKKEASEARWLVAHWVVRQTRLGFCSLGT